MTVMVADDGCNIYRADVYMARIGWFANVGWRTRDDGDERESVIALQGPLFWRPTRGWVLARTRRHVRRRLLGHARESLKAALLV